MINVKFKRLHPDAKVPRYMTEQAAGMDICAAPGFQCALRPGERKVVPTGLSLQLPVGTEAQVRPRSGLAAKWGVTVLNAPGTIDSDFRGEIGVILINHGDEDFWINSGDRIAQLVFASVTLARVQEVDQLDSTDRGEGGFGSTDATAEPQVGETWEMYQPNDNSYHVVGERRRIERVVGDVYFERTEKERQEVGSVSWYRKTFAAHWKRVS